MLSDKDRIFTNLYGRQDWRLEAAQKRGAWDNTKDLMAKGQEWIIAELARLLAELRQGPFDHGAVSARQVHQTWRFKLLRHGLEKVVPERADGRMANAPRGIGPGFTGTLPESVPAAGRAPGFGIGLVHL